MVNIRVPRIGAGLTWLRNSIGYHHILMLFIAVAIIILSFLLAGCSSSSPDIPSIYLISLYYDNYKPTISGAQADSPVSTAIGSIVGGANLEVRVGYFGICIQPDGGSFICNSNATILANVLRADQDPLNLIWVASTFRNAVVFPYLIIVALILAFLCFLLLATFPAWHEEADMDYKPLPSRFVSQISLALVFISSVFVLVSVLWQHTASVSATAVAQDLGNGSLKSGVGTSAMVLGWFGFGFLVIVTVGLLVMIMTLSLVGRVYAGEG